MTGRGARSAVRNRVPNGLADQAAAPAGLLMRQAMAALRRKQRRLIAKSWTLSRLYYPLHGARLSGRPNDAIWYFAYGANMHEATFQVRRGIQPFECRPGRIRGYRLRFNLEGRPRGRAASDAEVWACFTALPGSRWSVWIRPRASRGGAIAT